MDNFIGAASENAVQMLFFWTGRVCPRASWYVYEQGLVRSASAAFCCLCWCCSLQNTRNSGVVALFCGGGRLGFFCGWLRLLLCVSVVVALVPLIIGGGCPCSFVVGTAHVRPHRAVEPSTTEIDLDRSDLTSCI